MRIGINALAVTPERPGGDVSYVIELVRRLPGLDPTIEWRVFVVPAARPLLGALPANVRLVPCAVPPRSLVARALWEQTALVPRAMRERLDLLFAPVNVLPVAYPGKMVLTLHEAEPFMPGGRHQIPLFLRLWWRVMRSLSARRAARILTVSDAAKHDLAAFMGQRAGRARVVHLGVERMRFSPAEQAAAAAPLDGAPYVLWVGRPYPRKNLGTLLSAFAALRAAGHRERLVLIGPPGWNEAALRRRVQREFETGAVLRLPAVWADLPAWYAHAAAFVFPSIQETFGLPILEAMACGTPVIAADIPALREVGGDAAVYVDAMSSERFASALAGLLRDPRLGIARRQRGLDRVSEFDWSKTAQETLRQFREVVNQSGDRS